MSSKAKLFKLSEKSKNRIKSSASSAHHGTQAGRPRDHRSSAEERLQGSGGGAGLHLGDCRQLMPSLPEVWRRGS